MSENKLRLNKFKISSFYLFTLGFPSYLIAEVLVPVIVTKKATEILLIEKVITYIARYKNVVLNCIVMQFIAIMKKRKTTS